MKKDKITRLSGLVLSILLSISMLAGCAGETGNPPNNDAGGTSTPADNTQSATETKPDYSKHYDFTASVPENITESMDELSKTILKDYNMTLELVLTSQADLDQKNRIWISSGDMPDVVYSGFNYSDYRKYVEQGLVRQLPEDYTAKYPNLDRAMEASGIVDVLKEKHDGKIYASIAPIYVDKFIDPFGEHYCLYYRKDWAEACGLPVKDQYTMEEVMTMAKSFMQQDPGKNGAGKTIGFAVEPRYMIYSFLTPHLSPYDRIYKQDNAYVYGPAQPGVKDGLVELRKYYDEGVIYKDFFAIKARGEVEGMFNAGLTGLMINGGAFGNIKRLYNDFTLANPKMSALDSVYVANILGTDGKIHSKEFSNVQSMRFFSPHMEDDKFERLLSLFDYTATPEVQGMINMGFEGKDYTKEGETITLTRAKNENGDFIPMADLYPSYNFWSRLTIAWDDFTTKDPSTNPEILKRNKKLWSDRTNHGNMYLYDYDLAFYSSKGYDMSKSVLANIHNDFTNIVIKNEDVAAGWEKYIAENKSIYQPVLDEINKELI